MFGGLKKAFMRWAGERIKVHCPKCRHQFHPFRERPLTSWNDKIVCPKCGNEVALKESLATQRVLKVNPTGPFPRPAETKIEKKVVTETQLLFVIPASGRWGGLLFFSIFWNILAWPLFLLFLFSNHDPTPWYILPFVSIFPLIGIVFLYAALRTRFAIHLLYLSPEFIRLQRQLFGRSKNFNLVTANVTTVLKAEFYQQNYQPVYGIEIKTNSGKIRFGSILTDEEKNWLCWEISEFIKPHAPSLV
jgi:hypothetical protein